MAPETAITEKVKHELKEHKTELEVAGGIVATAAICWFGRGQLGSLVSAVRGTSSALPEFTVAGEAAESVAPRGLSLAQEVSSLTATRPQTVAEMLSEKTIRMGCKSAKTVLSAIRSKEAEVELVGNGAPMPSDELRRHVFNRFLDRLEPGNYVVHGSYALENQLGNGARKAFKDIDLLATNPEIAQGSRGTSSQALLDDLRRMASKDMGDGLTFEIAPHDTFSDRIFPRMRHLVATAKADGTEVMKLPLDIRIGANTILPPEIKTVTNTYNGVEHSATVAMMQKEENLAYKLYTYTNRYAGGLVRKPKDLRDMATMIDQGVDEGKVTKALQEWTSRGYEMAPMRHPSEILGADFTTKPELMFGQTPTQIDENFRTVKNFYQGIAPDVENVPLKSGTSTSSLSNARRFLEKHYVVYPVEMRNAF